MHLAGPEGSAGTPFPLASFDGQWIAFGNLVHEAFQNVRP